MFLLKISICRPLLSGFSRELAALINVNYVPLVLFALRLCCLMGLDLFCLLDSLNRYWW